MKSLAGTMSSNVHSVHPYVFDLGYLHSASSLCIVTYLIRSGRTAMCWAFFLWWLWAGPQHVFLAVRQRAYGMSHVLLRTQKLLPVEVTYSFQNTKKLLEVTSLNFPIKRCDHCRSSLSGHLCYMFNDMSHVILRTKSLLDVTCPFCNPNPWPRCQGSRSHLLIFQSKMWPL